MPVLSELQKYLHVALPFTCRMVILTATLCPSLSRNVRTSPCCTPHALLSRTASSPPPSELLATSPLPLPPPPPEPSPALGETHPLLPRPPPPPHRTNLPSRPPTRPS